MEIIKPNARGLIERGFLPENLPPVINSKSLWTSFEPRSGKYLVTKNTIASTSPFSASKRGGQRRIFSIPHPTFTHDAGVFFEKHWDDILDILKRSPGSLSKPKFGEGPRSVRVTPHSELPKMRLRAFSRFRYCVITDVSRCYPSIYTHSISWAIHGRDAAKRDRKHNSTHIFGNRLDFVMRQSQDGQTIGIAIGPDVSRVTAEIVMSGVDSVFLEKYKNKKPTYIRHVDDYWIGGDTIEECENHLKNLRLSLREFELDINDLKTKIVTTTNIMGESWPSEFEREIHNSFRRHLTPGSDSISTLSKIIDRATAENDDGMIRHAIRRTDDNHLWKEQWDILEHFLAQCAVQFPHSFDYVARVIAWRARLTDQIDKSLWQHVVSNVISQASPLGRDTETIWALWFMSELKMPISKNVSEMLLNNNSPLVLAYLAHAFANGRTRDKTLGKKLWESVDGNPYSGGSWPLTLELLNLDVTAPSEYLPNNVDSELMQIFVDRSSLIDWDARPRVFIDDDGEDLDEPESAIEDYTSDYDDDHDEDEGDELDHPSWALPDPSNVL